MLGLPTAARSDQLKMADHDVSKSLNFADHDGNRIELFVDRSDIWKRDPSAVASYKPLTL